MQSCFVLVVLFATASAFMSPTTRGTLPRLTRRAATNDDDSRKKQVKSAAAGALAGGLVAGPVGAVIGFAVGDMMSSSKKPQQQVDPAQKLAANLASTLEDAKKTLQSIDNLIIQREKDIEEYSKRQDELLEMARSFIVAEDEANARKCLEQKNDLGKRKEKFEVALSEDKLRRVGVEKNIVTIEEKIGEVEQLFARLSASRVEEATNSLTSLEPLDPLEEKFRRLEGKN
jgi:hypothetical protein